MDRFLLMETLMAGSPTSQPAGMSVPSQASPAAAAGDMATSTTSSHFSPSMIIIFVVLLSAFFFMGFFAVYVRRCTTDVDPDFSVSWRRGIFGNPTGVAAAGAGVDSSLLETFPMVSYLSVKRKGCNECVVCLADFEASDTLRQLPKCKHVFHPACIGMWLESHNTCPVCRRNLLGNDKWSVSFHWGGSGSSRYAGSRSGRGDREGSNSVNLRSAEEQSDRRQTQSDSAAAGPDGPVQVPAMPTTPTSGASKAWRRLRRSYSTGNSLLRDALQRAASQVGTPPILEVVVERAGEVARLPLRRTRSWQELDDGAGSRLRQSPLL